jgi:hypothetical protein
MSTQPLNLNSTTPAAPSGSVNLPFAADAPNADLAIVRNVSISAPVMTNLIGGLVPAPPNLATEYLDGTGHFSTPAGGGGGGGSAIGGNVCDLPWIGTPGSPNTSSFNINGYAFCQFIGGNAILNPSLSWTISFDYAGTGAQAFIEFTLLRTLKGSLAVTDVTRITFASSATPTFSSPGVQTSDTMTVTIDALHDYYFIVNGGYTGVTNDIVSNSYGGGNLPTMQGFNTNVGGGTALATSWASFIGGGSGSWSAACPLGTSQFWLSDWIRES